MDAPFFCHDVTDRAFRVACEDKAKTTHACGAKGIAAIEVLIPWDRMEEYAVLWGKIVGSEPEVKEDETAGKEIVLDVGVPNGGGRSKIVLKEAKSEKGLLRMKQRGIGFSDLVIAIDRQSERKWQQCGTEGIEATIWLE